MTVEVLAGLPLRDKQGGGGTPSEARMAVVRRLSARRPEIDEVIFARVRDLAPGAAALEDPEYVAGLRTAVVAAVDYVLEGLAHEGGPFPRIPSAAVAQARRAARAGVGLDTLLRRYVAGHAIVEDFVMQEAGHGEQGWIPPSQMTGLRRMLERSASLLDRLILSITSAYVRELEQDGGSPARRGRPLASTPQDRQSGGAGGGSSRTHQHIALDQRARILQALVDVVAERGFAAATVGLVVARAGVSTRTFYQLFENLEGCLTAVVDRGFEQAAALMAQALAREEHWLDGVRAGLGAWLEFFDREPGLARVCFVDALAAGPGAVEHRERRVLALTTVVAAELGAPQSELPPFTLRSVVALVLGAIHAQLVLDGRGSLLELLGPLMGVIGGMRLYPEQAAREIERGGAHARSQLAERERASGASGSAPGNGSSYEGSGVLGARRARECVLFLAAEGERGHSPSNREIAAGIGVTQQSQISRLLASLGHDDLASKRSEGAGKRNAWRLTPRGEAVARGLSERRDQRPTG